ncbi:MAG: hypothetical protein JSV52_08380 [Candidatus Zixiibacteriota bacterium]|nr:MAG: hypothetical protein JSV52_08380 [candidate division Zixibacteria bacterium]
MSHKLPSVAICLISIIITAGAADVGASAHPSYSYVLPVDTVPFYPDGTYDESIPKPNDYLKHPVGSWPARFDEIINYLEILAGASDRVLIETHGSTHEGRSQYNLFIGTPENIGKLQEIKARTAQLASADGLKSRAEVDAFVENLPATAWLGYSIHGDEYSGTDAAVQLAYQLAAGTDSATMHLLNNVLIILDPCENPDGRERALSMLQTYKSYVPNYDMEAQQHGGVWPWGRGNHYLFDLNRDWILLTQPETKGRVKTQLDWNPQLVVDAHEMGADDNYLFSPPRQPINYNTPENVFKWWEIFSRDQGLAFDQRGWPYYVKEWHEHWYPGYGSQWLTFLGAVGILYEQAGVDGGVVRQEDDYLLTYHEAVNHQFTSSLANLRTLANNRREIIRDYWQARQDIVSEGHRSGLAYLFVPDSDELKMNRFISSLLGQGIQIHRAKEDFTVRSAVDIYHEEHASKKFPSGSYIVKTDQTHGNLIKAICEFDPHLKLEFLKEERRELEKYGDTRIYDVSGWSTPLAYDIDAYETKSPLAVSTELVTEVTTSIGKLFNPEAQFGFVINMEGEKTYRMLNRMFGEELMIYASQKPFSIEGRDYLPGSLVLRKRGNPDDLVSVLQRLAGEVGINVYGVNTAMSTSGSYLGAGTFRLLNAPKIALVSGEPLSGGSFGSLWFAIDRELEIPHSIIRIQSLAYSDLSRYNVLIIPSSWWGGFEHVLGKHGANRLSEWVSDGGILVCTGNSAFWAADTTTGLSGVRLKRQVLDKLKDFDKVLKREIQAEAPQVDTMALWHPDKVTAKKEEPEEKAPPAGKEELEDRDEWQRRFFPRGVIMRADLDTEDWLAFGMKKRVPVSLYTHNALMPGEHVQTSARLCPDQNKLRMSGLLWPEARERWAGTAYATRERHGKGQIILFAGDPNPRAYFYGTRKMFINAILYGPGMGTYGEEPYDKEG